MSDIILHSIPLCGNGQGFEQPNLVKDMPTHGRVTETDDLQRVLPMQTILGFCEVRYEIDLAFIMPILNSHPLHAFCDLLFAQPHLQLV